MTPVLREHDSYSSGTDCILEMPRRAELQQTEFKNPPRDFRVTAEGSRRLPAALNWPPRRVTDALKLRRGPKTREMPAEREKAAKLHPLKKQRTELRYTRWQFYPIQMFCRSSVCSSPSQCLRWSGCPRDPQG
ncbi:hypothetical protein GN956_G4394 [Arapaima gigas]